MPNGFSEDSSAESEATPTEDGNQAERFTAIRVRDVKTGRFVAAPSLVTKGMPKSVTRIMEASTAGIIGGVIANQAPQNNRSWKTNKKKLKKLEDDLSVKLVKKSFVPGKGFIPASKMTKAELKMAAFSRKSEAAGGPGTRKHAEQEKQQDYRDWHKSMKGVVDDAKKGGPLMSGPKGSVMYAPGKGDSAMPPGAGAYAVATGGRQGERIMVVPKDSAEHTVRHEIAHLTPKRSSYRLHQIIKNPERAMREEARADMLGSKKGYYKTNRGDEPSGYSEAANSSYAATMQRMMAGGQGDGVRMAMFDDKGLNAYRGTQDKMVAAGYKFRGNQYVDEKKMRRMNRGEKFKQYGSMGAIASGGGYTAYRLNRKPKKDR